jgi:colanic acid biosynthesis glycosyl transferase WcaI
MLASGRPVLACAEQGTELANVVSSCGLVVPPGSPTEFVDALFRLAADRHLREYMGLKGYSYASNFLDRDLILSGFEAKIVGMHKF